MPDSNLSRKLNFVNRSIGSKVTAFAQMLNNALAPTSAAKSVEKQGVCVVFVIHCRCILGHRGFRLGLNENKASDGAAVLPPSKSAKQRF